MFCGLSLLKFETCSVSAELQNIKNQLCRHRGKTDGEDLPFALPSDDEERRSGMCVAVLFFTTMTKSPIFCVHVF